MPKPSGGSTRTPRSIPAPAIALPTTSALRRGRIHTFSNSAWTAIVRLEGSLAAVTLPVLETVPASMLASGDRVAVLMFDDTNPDDGVVLGPYGAVGGIVPELFDVVTADVEVVNTITETNLWSFSLPANTLLTNNLLRIQAFGSYLNNSGAGSNITLRFKYGATTLLTRGPDLSATNAARKWQDLRISLKGDAATNAQRATWILNLPAVMDAASQFVGNEGTSAIDSTAAATLALTIEHGTAAATISYILRFLSLELLRAL